MLPDLLVVGDLDSASMEVVGTSCAMEVGDLDPVDWIVVMKN
jgi:hypothetical protein